MTVRSRRPTAAISGRPPFSDQFAIAELEPMPYGKSGESFRVVTDDGRRYKLRSCPSVGDAVALETTLRRCPPGVFPRLLGRDRQYLLMAFIEGRTVDVHDDPATDPGAARLARRFYRSLGRLHARMHRRSAVGDPEKLDRKFRGWAADLREGGRISRVEERQVRKLYAELRRDVDYQFSMDLTAVNHRNFLLTADRLYAVDEGSIAPLKGKGLAKLIAKHDRKQTSKRAHLPYWRQLVAEGYRSTGSSFPSDRYLDLLYLFMAVSKNRSQLGLSGKTPRRHLDWLVSWVDSRRAQAKSVQ